MKTFKDVIFKKHRLGDGCIQGLLMLDNGIEISVVAGNGMYSAGKTGVRGPINKAEDVSSFEVAIFDQDGEFIGDDMVLSWQSREDINNIIEKFS
jgi:hypothetical protein|tara:strand:- start:2140 stop:2424 length:285 start_codon:yes stop_codon:yes gene_type:complete